MLRLVVKSTAINSMGYDERNRILEIEYKNGNVYRYKEVPRHVWDEMKRSEAIGAYVNANIRDKYDFLE